MEYDFLNESEKRVLLGYCADSILNRTSRNMEIESWFSSAGHLDSLFYDVLLFIMDYSLSFENGCTMRDIEGFLAEDLTAYGYHFSPEMISRLSIYMIRDILQNGGTVHYYNLFDHATDTWHQARVRLIQDDERNGLLYYRLSEQGYDFLLRTKEVDSQFEGWVSMLIVQEQLQHHNFKESFDQSRQALNILQAQKTRFNEFLARVRRDINSIHHHEYSQMLNSFYANLTHENKLTGETIQIVQEYRRKLSQEDHQNVRRNKDVKESLQYLNHMAVLLNHIFAEERKLLDQRFSLSDLYKAMLVANLNVSTYRQYDLNEVILKRVSSFQDNDFIAFGRLLNPLFCPETDKILNIDLLYSPEDRIEEVDETPELIESAAYQADEDLEKKKLISRRYAIIMDYLLKYASRVSRHFLLSEFITWVRPQIDDFYDYAGIGRHHLFLMFLSLYHMGKIDLQKTGTDHHDDLDQEDFDLDRALAAVREEHPDLYGIRTLCVSGNDQHITIPVLNAQGNMLSTVGINNFIVDAEEDNNDE